MHDSRDLNRTKMNQMIADVTENISADRSLTQLSFAFAS